MIKINNGFVTNSSSTSFIISSKNKKLFTKKQFFNLIGIKDESMLNEVFENLYNVIISDAQPIENIISSSESLEDFLKNKGFSIIEIQEICKRYKSGESVFFGRLNDSGRSEEVYFCYQSFIVIDDDFYFNAEVDAY